MYTQGNNVARSCNHCCVRKATVHFVRTIELHVAANYIKIMSVAQQSFYRKCVFPAKIKRS